MVASKALSCGRKAQVLDRAGVLNKHLKFDATRILILRPTNAAMKKA
jgi:hypothetical protein